MTIWKPRCSARYWTGALAVPVRCAAPCWRWIRRTFADRRGNRVVT
ncbi:hypothetical protein AB5I41_11365 [Sphingomonas sp. MMS24-JH45]